MEGTDSERYEDPPERDPAGEGAVLAKAHETLRSARSDLACDRYEEAAGSARIAAHLFRHLSTNLAEARALRLLADCLIGAGRAADALEAAGSAARTFDRTPEATTADGAGCERVLGTASRALGDLDGACRHLDTSARGFDAAGLPGRAATSRLAHAVVLHSQGDLEGAVELLLEVRAALLETRRADAVATCDFDLGVALHDLGEMDDAIEYLQQARTIFSSLGREGDVAACNQNLGVALQAMGRSSEAQRRLRDARASFRALGRERDAAQCDHNLGVVVRSIRDGAMAAAPDHSDEAAALSTEHEARGAAAG